MVAEKLPPHDIEAEEAVVGSLLIDSDAFFKIAAFLRAQDFYREKNQWTYEACSALYERNEVIDQVTV
ncbi:MAG: DnaB-like helicase N-terminal domain-containing protein, partial [Chloroflexota bacterium]